jgi:hypothetical protein
VPKRERRFHCTAQCSEQLCIRNPYEWQQMMLMIWSRE